MNFLNKKNNNQTTANVIDNHLILSIPNAKNPVLWRMELKKTGAASFEVKEDKSGSYLLIIKPTKTTSETIAPFDHKQDAVDALMAASTALQNAPSNSSSTGSNKGNNSGTKNKKSSTQNNGNNDNKSGSTWLIVILGTATVIGLFAYLLSLAPKDTTLKAQTISSIQNSSPQKSTGVPVSADDFLRTD